MSSALEAQRLKTEGFTHLLNVSGHEYPFEDDFETMSINLRDTPDETFMGILDLTNQFIRDVPSEGKILVFCFHGVLLSWCVSIFFYCVGLFHEFGTNVG